MDLDAGDRAVGLVLPEMPGPRPVFDRWLVLRRSDPDRIVHEGAVGKDRLVEVDRGVDDRPLAVVALHLFQHHLHVGDGAFLGEMPMAGLRRRRRLDVEHRRQRVVLDRRVLLEIGHLLQRRPAPVDEMIGAVRHSGRLRAGPVGLEARVGVIAAFGRLDPGELDAAVGDRVPVDVALELGDVDAVDRVVASASANPKLSASRGPTPLPQPGSAAASASATALSTREMRILPFGIVSLSKSLREP